MSWFLNLQTKIKIYALIILMAVFMGLVGVVGYYYNQKANVQITKMYTNNLMAIKYLNSSIAQVTNGMLHTLMLLLESDKSMRKSLSDNMKIQEDLFDKTFADYLNLPKDPYETKRITDIKDKILIYRAGLKTAIDMGDSGDYRDAYDYFKSNPKKFFDGANILLAELANYNSDKADKTKSQNDHDFTKAKLIIIGLPIVALIISLIFGYLIARVIANPLREAVALIVQVADGNLAIEELRSKSKDEVGHMSITFNRMVTSLRSLIMQVSESSEKVAASSEELLAITEENTSASNQIALSISKVASGTESQTFAVNETSSAIEQISASIQQVSASSNNVDILTIKTSTATSEGQGAVKLAVDQMDKVSQVTEEVQKAVNNVAQSSEKIKDIINVISSIADQTNLLALNAAIEAARAGEQGRGFAVVAEEVRKLAEQSQQAANEITSLINMNQENIDNAVIKMNAGAINVKVGVETVHTAGNAFNQIAHLVNEVSTQVQEISKKIREMAKGSEQIVHSSNKVDTISKDMAVQVQTVSASMQEQSASMEQIASSSQVLATMAQELQNSVIKFKF